MWFDIDCELIVCVCVCACVLLEYSSTRNIVRNFLLSDIDLFLFLLHFNKLFMSLPYWIHFSIVL